MSQSIEISDLRVNWLEQLTDQVDTIYLADHVGGFDKNLRNPVLDELDSLARNANKCYHVNYHMVLDHTIKQHYPNLKITFGFYIWKYFEILNQLLDYNQHPEIDFKNFICSFNGSAHVSRKLLTAALHRRNWFNPETCSKNFSYTGDQLFGHIADYVPEQQNFYNKFFISNSSEDFFQRINSFGHMRYDHQQNIHILENKLTQSFLHVVSETMSTSYYPFVSEKFLYSVVTRGLFLTYGQPGWHEHLEKYYGFKRYTKLFDYRFDSIQNPIERLVELMSMISKFSVLSQDDWKDLYEIEKDTIEYNYNHYFSQDYLKCLAKYE